jgi:hypothetical protein
MSSFTKAHAAITYDAQASAILGKDYWRNLGFFRFYIGAEGSKEWVDVEAGVLSDGATVPFPVNALIPAWGSYGQAVLLHDRLCNTYYKYVEVNGVVTKVDIDRAEIDSILAEAMEVLKVSPTKRATIMAGIHTYRIVTRPKQPVRRPERVRLEANYNPANFVF